MDAELNGATEIVVANAGTAVQHQRDRCLLANSVQPREVEFGVAFVLAVGIANGDG